VKRLLVVMFCASTSLYGSAVLVTSPSGLNANEFVSWAQVNPVFSSFTTETAGESLTGTFSSGSGKVVQACSGSKGCLAGGGIAQNDYLLLTEAPSYADSSVTFSFDNSYSGVGAYLEGVSGTSDAGTTFTIRIQAFNGVNSVLTSTALVTSDSKGDPIFVGVSDAAQEITKVIFSLTDANGNPITGNFALDTLDLYNAPVIIVDPPVVDPPAPAQQQSGDSTPEPGVMFLVGPALIALAIGVRKRGSRA